MEYKIIDTNEFYKYLDKMVDLYNVTFRNKVDRTYYLWRYINNPCRELLIALAIENGNVISSYSYMPFFLSVNKATYKAALAIHLMTLPDHKGQGISTKLCQVLIPYLVEHGYKMICGFPNLNSHAFHVNRLGWVDIYEFPTMSCPVPVAAELKSVVIRDDQFRLDYSLIERYTNKISVYKDARFLRWRYGECPNCSYPVFAIAENENIKAYAVVKKYENKINIVDHFYEDEKDMEDLLSAVSQYAADQKAELITTWANINSEYNLFLERKGFQHDLPVTYFGGRVLDESTPLNYQIQNWNIVMGDDNVY